jgi:hypothetical protein
VPSASFTSQSQGSLPTALFRVRSCHHFWDFHEFGLECRSLWVAKSILYQALEERGAPQLGVNTPHKVDHLPRIGVSWPACMVLFVLPCDLVHLWLPVLDLDRSFQKY